jgi:CBS-domain-containing membrane protein
MSGILQAKPKVGYLINEEHTNSVLVEQIAKQKVEKVMAISVNLTKETSIQDAIIQLFLEDCGSLYVTDNREILGIVSRKDLLKSASGRLRSECHPGRNGDDEDAESLYRLQRHTRCRCHETARHPSCRQFAGAFPFCV